jgi:glycogen phosphorylase/synthase
MNPQITISPDYLFEVSWEICNKVGGIYTVIATKAPGMQREFGDNYILIGPDVWKETAENPDFIEDKFIYRSWREKAESEGLHLKVGRWNIKGHPVVVLVDFTPFFAVKDKIFAEFWEKYKLDSISGNWDYIEPALFGYAAGRIIESFYEYNLSAQDKIIAQFHEWMTGAGVLYLRDRVPQAGCVFTTHATMLGRCIAGNNLPLYSDFNTYNPDNIAQRFNINAKYSLERLAAENCDTFTTVSLLTAEECRQFLGREVDIITPNGFDENLIPTDLDLATRRSLARNRLLDVARALLNQDIPADSMLIVNSGRYEFRNKGIDLLIDALGSINRLNEIQKTIVAFFMIPANQLGPANGLKGRIGKPDFNNPHTDYFITHSLFESEHDPILRSIRENNMHNSPADKVKIIFVPAYLNGADGIFNMNYYDLLTGFDLSAFPSYYEPWGYTPLESLAFSVPTVTTSLTGFGRWIVEKMKNGHTGITVIERDDTNSKEVVEQLIATILKTGEAGTAEMEIQRTKARELARIALWSNLAVYYADAYTFALGKAEKRSELFRDKRQVDTIPSYTSQRQKKPIWQKILIKPSFPSTFKRLQRISRNLWWTWNTEAAELFEMIDPLLWEQTNHNPIALLEALSSTQLEKLADSKDFMDKLSEISSRFEMYMADADKKPQKQVAYFSMEYGLHDTIQIYSGGLGMLAGDYLKEASDSNINLIGIGLLYRYGYFRQSITLSGDQIASYSPQKFTHLPIKPVRDDHGVWIKINLALPGRNLTAKVWRVDVGRIHLYLLDADISDNSEADRTITHHLYGGDWDNRLKQELLLGVGGIRLLNAIGLKPDIYHCNEGHAAFIGIERLREMVQDQKLSFSQALEIVRSSTLFTTHTPVPAGHDAFSEDMLRAYIPHYAVRLNITWNTFMNLGRYIENKLDEKFSMSVLAARLSQEINGVSRIHGRVTREMFEDMYEGYYAQELHIGYVTNGVHYPTWTAERWQKLYLREFGEAFLSDQSNEKYWKLIHKVSDENIWKIRQELRKELIVFLRHRLSDDLTTRQENPKLILQTIESLDEKALTIGFARRFATYKRAHLLFSNLDRLSEIMNMPNRPVQLVFAGKAHPADKAGQDLIKRIIEVARMPKFVGKIVFIENYDIALAKRLVQGVDIWLNTPTRPLEASGTSGEKAIMNGVVNFSVLDGWWAEGYLPEAGWALKEERTYNNQQIQDELDSETIYNILENEIVPAFYGRSDDRIPHEWISYIKNTISGIAPHFTMKRQLDDYIEKYYTKLFARSEQMQKNKFELPRQIAAWKRKMIRGWESIEVVSLVIPNSTEKPLHLGDVFAAEIIIDTNELSPEDIGIELLLGQKVNDEVNKLLSSEKMKLISSDGSLATFKTEVTINKAGVYDIAFRIFPDKDFLPHRLDFNLVKWA